MRSRSLYHEPTRREIKSILSIIALLANFPCFVEVARRRGRLALGTDAEDGPIAEAGVEQGVGPREVAGAEGVAAVEDHVLQPVPRVRRDQGRDVVGRRIAFGKLD